MRLRNVLFFHYFLLNFDLNFCFGLGFVHVRYEIREKKSSRQVLLSFKFFLFVYFNFFLLNFGSRFDFVDFFFICVIRLERRKLI